MKSVLIILCGAVLGPSPLQADLGLDSELGALSATALSKDSPAFAVCFNASEDLEARALALYCSAVAGTASYVLSLNQQEAGRPGKPLAKTGGVVPKDASWIVGHLDGHPLKKGERVCLVMGMDGLRGGGHAVESPEQQGRHKLVLPLSMALKPGMKPADARTFWQAAPGGSWTAAAGEPLWAMLGRGRRIQGNAWTETLALPVHGGLNPLDPADDLWQAHVFHFPCGQKPTSVRVRVRKIGRPKAPLILVLLKHNYQERLTRPVFDMELARPEKISSAWQWIETPISAPEGSFAPGCHYVALKSSAGRPEGNSCSDCYEVSALRVMPGLELAQELSWHGGAHKDRASSSLNGQHWLDDFEADLNLVVVGPPCVQPPAAASPPLFPTPFPSLP